MPLYRFSCPACGDFEKRAGFEDSSVLCRCGGAALRSPFSGGVGVIVEGRLLPTAPADVLDGVAKNLRRTGWDYDRAMTGIRKNTTRDRDGNRVVNTEGLATA